MRQDHAAARHRRAGTPGRRAHPASTARCSATPRAALHVAPEQRRIGMVFQDYALFPHLSVEANVAFGLRHLDAAQRRTRTQEVLDLVGPGPCRAARPAPTLGRPAAAHRTGPCAGAAIRACCCWTSPSPASTSTFASGSPRSCAASSSRPQTTALFVTHDQLEAFARRRPDRRHAPRAPRTVGRRLHPVPPAGDPLRGRFHRARRVHAGADRRQRAAGSADAHPAGRPGRRRRNARCPRPTKGAVRRAAARRRHRPRRRRAR